MRYLYFARDDKGYILLSEKATMQTQVTPIVFDNVKLSSLCTETFERVTKRKLKVGEQIRIPEKKFAKLFEKVEVVKQ